MTTGKNLTAGQKIRLRRAKKKPLRLWPGRFAFGRGNGERMDGGPVVKPGGVAGEAGGRVRGVVQLGTAPGVGNGGGLEAGPGSRPRKAGTGGHGSERAGLAGAAGQAGEAPGGPGWRRPGEIPPAARWAVRA